MDGIPLVGDAGIGFPKEVTDAEAAGLVLKIGLVDGAEEENGKIAGVTVFEDFAGAREEGDRVVQLPENLAEDFLEFMNRGVGDVFLIKALVGEIEFLPEGLPVERRFAVGGEDSVGGFQHGGEVVHQGAGPVED